MKHIWLISAAVFMFGFCNGLFQNASPQASLYLKLSSEVLGVIGAGIPLGYAVSCLLWGRIFAKASGKNVLRGGLVGALCGFAIMSRATTAAECIVAQIVYGLSAGAFWPFASAWLLDFQSAEISKARLLRHYNVAWTSGTGLGMYCSGVLCECGKLFETFYLGAGLVLVTFILASLPAARPHQHTGGAPARADSRTERVSLPILLAAILANLAALGTRGIVLNNYAELNSFLGGGAERMAIITSLTVAGQFVMFSLGNLYENWLGMRRVCFISAALLCVINLLYAYATGLPLLIVAAVLHGAVLAISFQTGILAAIRYFASPRTGTTFHEAVVGVGGLAPVAAGMLVAGLKQHGTGTAAALRSPFLFLCGMVLLMLLGQVLLISSRSEQRILAKS